MTRVTRHPRKPLPWIESTTIREMSSIRFHIAFVALLAVCGGIAAGLGNGHSVVVPTHEFAFTAGEICGDAPTQYECTRIRMVDADAIPPDFRARSASEFPPGTRILFTRRERVSAIAWSPDAQEMAYLVVHVSGLPPNYYDPVGSELWVSRIDGSGARRLSTNVVALDDLHGLKRQIVSWSTDGSIAVKTLPIDFPSVHGSVGYLAGPVSPDGKFAAVYISGPDSGSICVRSNPDTLGRTNGQGCFGDGLFLGDVVWAPF